MLGSDFDLRAIRSALSAERCWDLFTAHVDRLQRLEERLAEAVRKADRSRARSREQVLGLGLGLGVGSNPNPNPNPNRTLTR